MGRSSTLEETSRFVTERDDHQLAGEELDVARRAVTVALLVSVAPDGFHPVMGLLPPRVDLVRMLDHLGSRGAVEPHVSLTPADRVILQEVVYATLILALEESETTAYQALRSTSGTAEVDRTALVALESLAGLALALQGDGRLARADGALGPASVHGASLVSPALNALADSIGLPVWIANADLTLEWINPALEEILEAGREQVQGTPWARWCDPTDQTRTSQVVDAARLEQRNWSLELGVGPSGGPYTRLLVVAAPRQCPAGSLLGWTGICFDVTANAQLWTRLEPVTRPLVADAARSHLLLDQLPGVIWTTDLELRCTSSLGAGLRALDVAPNALVGMPVANIVRATDDLHPALQAHRAALAGESARYRDTVMGREWETYIEPLRDPRGEIVGCVGLSLDITDTLAREQHNRQLMRQLEFAQSVARMGSWEVDMSTGKWLWSDEAYRLLGAEPGAIEPSFEAFLGRVHPDDRDRLVERHTERKRVGEGYEMPYRLVRFDGEVRQMRGSVRFEHDADGTLMRVAGILQDITPLDGVVAPDR